MYAIAGDGALELYGPYDTLNDALEANKTMPWGFGDERNSPDLTPAERVAAQREEDDARVWALWSMSGVELGDAPGQFSVEGAVELMNEVAEQAAVAEGPARPLVPFDDAARVEAKDLADAVLAFLRRDDVSGKLDLAMAHHTTQTVDVLKLLAGGTLTRNDV